eukprot:TRINITY_DN12108_c0_g1_i2.p2 TRINITY_DN12108_c0_g1~~TRINITY_DN12108_c0_g1_i2.p2  ORF type:complete len:399 (+),score=9.49 TRINITY_DN12108_c0_g1_i2:1523-2719(+)
MYAFAKCMTISYKHSSHTIYAVFCPADSIDLGIQTEFDRKVLDATKLATYSKDYNYSQKVGASNQGITVYGTKIPWNWGSGFLLSDVFSYAWSTASGQLSTFHQEAQTVQSNSSKCALKSSSPPYHPNTKNQQIVWKVWVGSDISIGIAETITLEQVFYEKNTVSIPTDVVVDTICQVQLDSLNCTVDNSAFNTSAKLTYTLTNKAGKVIVIQTYQILAITFYVSHLSSKEPSVRNFGVDLKYGSSVINSCKQDELRVDFSWEELEMTTALDGFLTTDYISVNDVFAPFYIEFATNSWPITGNTQFLFNLGVFGQMNGMRSQLKIMYCYVLNNDSTVSHDFKSLEIFQINFTAMLTPKTELSKNSFILNCFGGGNMRANLSQGGVQLSFQINNGTQLQ